VGGLCQGDSPNTDVLLRSTTPDEFVAGKGLPLTDMAAPQYTDVAYVIVSHGPTGFGGYTAASGARLPMPGGDEDKNTEATGPFTIKAHSDLDTEATSNAHFDDLLVYRRIADLAQRIGLGPRNWFDVGTSSLLFTQANVSAAVGTSVSPGSSTGQSTIEFPGGARVSGITGTSTATEITFDTSGGTEGLGVAGGGDTMIQSTANESLQFRFATGARRLGVTLANIGYYGWLYVEVVQVSFYRNDTLVGSPYVSGCGFADGGMGSFTVSFDQVFDRVDVAALPALQYFDGTFTGTSAFLVAEVKACDSTAAECRTSLDVDAARRCPPP
jgi:hypothetical protein